MSSRIDIAKKYAVICSTIWGFLLLGTIGATLGEDWNSFYESIVHTNVSMLLGLMAIFTIGVVVGFFILFRREVHLIEHGVEVSAVVKDPSEIQFKGNAKVVLEYIYDGRSIAKP